MGAQGPTATFTRAALVEELRAIAAALAAARARVECDQPPELAAVAARLGDLLTLLEGVEAREVAMLHLPLIAVLDELERLVVAVTERRDATARELEELASRSRALRAYGTGRH